MHELPKKRSLSTPARRLPSMTLVWMARLSCKKSAGCAVLAWIPPTLAAAKYTWAGRVVAKKSCTAAWSRKSSSVEARNTRLRCPEARNALTNADPTIPVWPAT